VGFTQPASGNGIITAVYSGHASPSPKLYFVPPSSTFIGNASFTYTIADRAGARSTATVSVHVVASPENEAPTVTVGQSFTVDSFYPLPTVVVLQGNISDDGLPSQDLYSTWTLTSNLGDAQIDDAGRPSTIVYLTGDVRYDFHLSASDGILQVPRVPEIFRSR